MTPYRNMFFKMNRVIAWSVCSIFQAEKRNLESVQSRWAFNLTITVNEENGKNEFVHIRI